MIHIFKKGNFLEDIAIYTDENIKLKDSSENEISEHFECLNEEDLFLKLLQMFPKEPYWRIFDILKNFNISATRDFLIKSYCSKSARLRYYAGENLYLVFNYSENKFNLEILFICTYYEYKNYINNENYSVIKIKKETLPFYLSLFLNRFTSRDFYFCFKNITGLKNIPVISYNSSEFYLVKNRNKIISYHISEDTALKTLNLVNELNDENNKYFNPGIIKVNNYEEFLTAIDNSKIKKASDFDRYMIDYDWYFDYCISKKHIDVSNLILDNDVFLIRDKTGETIAKENQKDMYNYIKNNKLYSEDIFYFRKSDINFNDTNKYFNLIEKEFSHDDILLNYLSTIDYLSKVKIVNSLLDKISSKNIKGNIYYSLNKINEKDSKLLFFNDISFFHKHMASFEYGTCSLSHGELDITSIRRILEPALKNRNNTNKVFSRADVAFNISNLFKEDNHNGDYLKSIKNMTSVIDVDAYLKENKSSCGVVIRNNNNEIIVKIAKKLDASTSVEAEIKGAMFALEYITSLEPDLSKDICLRYDCFSVADYLVSEATSDIGKIYKDFVKNIIKKHPNLNIYIKKVRGHSSDFFNDIAHSLAGNFFNY